jgi:uncharacterized protein YqeY
LDEAELITVIQKEASVRVESIEEAQRANRMELISPLESELAVLKSYLPEPLSSDELQQLVREAIAETGASGVQEMGQVMKLLMPRVHGRADGKTVSEAVRLLLSGG